MLLLLLFMVLAVVDLFISFFGGLVLGVLLVQFELEVLRFFKRSSALIPKQNGTWKRYSNLSREYKMLLKAGMLSIVFILMFAGVLHTFWGGLFSGVLLALLADNAIRYQQQRSRQRITVKKN